MACFREVTRPLRPLRPRRVWRLSPQAPVQSCMARLCNAKKSNKINSGVCPPGVRSGWLLDKQRKGNALLQAFLAKGFMGAAPHPDTSSSPSFATRRRRGRELRRVVRFKGTVVMAQHIRPWWRWWRWLHGGYGTTYWHCVPCAKCCATKRAGAATRARAGDQRRGRSCPCLPKRSVGEAKCRRTCNRKAEQVVNEAARTGCCRPRARLAAGGRPPPMSKPRLAGRRARMTLAEAPCSLAQQHRLAARRRPPLHARGVKGAAGRGRGGEKLSRDAMGGKDAPGECTPAYGPSSGAWRGASDCLRGKAGERHGVV
jgi:hypothetical protein